MRKLWKEYQNFLTCRKACDRTLSWIRTLDIKDSAYIILKPPVFLINSSILRILFSESNISRDGTPYIPMSTYISSLLEGGRNIPGWRFNVENLLLLIQITVYLSQEFEWTQPERINKDPVHGEIIGLLSVDFNSSSKGPAAYPEMC